jgi:hypothetical protein
MTNQPAAVPAQPSYNILAIIGFVISLLGFNVVAIILGAIGLSQIKKSGERGRGFALAAIWIGAISVVLGIIAIIALFAIAAAGAGTNMS